VFGEANPSSQAHHAGADDQDFGRTNSHDSNVAAPRDLAPDLGLACAIRPPPFSTSG
jgi:hypothetical protein